MHDHDIVTLSLYSLYFMLFLIRDWNIERKLYTLPNFRTRCQCEILNKLIHVDLYVRSFIFLPMNPYTNTPMINSLLTNRSYQQVNPIYIKTFDNCFHPYNT